MLPLSTVLKPRTGQAAPLPVRQPNFSFRGALAASGRADIFGDGAEAEIRQATLIDRQQQRQASQQRQAQRSASTAATAIKPQDTAKLQADAEEKARKEALAKEVEKASLVKSAAPKTLTDSERESAAKKVGETEASLRAAAASALQQRVANDPKINEDDSWVPFMGNPTEEAAKLQAERDRLNDPTNVTDTDLEAYRATAPEQFKPLDELRTKLSKDDEDRAAAMDAERQLNVARAKADGLTDEEIAATLPPAPAKPIAKWDAVAESGKLEREAAEIDKLAAVEQSHSEQVAQLQQRENDIRTRLQAGVRGEESEALMQELAAIQTDTKLKIDAAARAKVDRETRASALTAKQQLLTERTAKTQERAAPKVTADTAKALATTDATGNVEIADADALDALDADGKAAFWKAATPPTPAAREAKRAEYDKTLTDLRAKGAELTKGKIAAVQQIEERVKAGTLSPQDAEAEAEKALTQFEDQHEEESAAVNVKLTDAVRDFSEGLIDSSTLNTIADAAGTGISGVELFREQQKSMAQDKANADALVDIIADKSAENPGMNGEAVALTANLARYDSQAKSWQSMVDGTFDYTGADMSNPTYGTTPKEAAAMAERRQKLADQTRQQLTTKRNEWKSAMTAELVKRGVPTEDHARIIADAEMKASEKAIIGFSEALAARGGGIGAAASATAEKVPLIGGLFEVARLAPYADMALRLEAGEKLNDDELAALSEFSRFASRQQTFMLSVADGVASSLSFGAEIALSAGTSAALKQGGMAAFKKAMSYVTTDAAKAALGKATLSTGKTLLSKVAKNVLVKAPLYTVTTGASKTLASFTRDTALQGVQVTEDEGRIIAAIGPDRHDAARRTFDAVFDQSKEFLTEKLGRAIPLVGRMNKGNVLGKSWAAMSDKVRNAVVSKAIIGTLKKLNPAVQNAAFGKFLKAANVQGIGTEFLEERAGDVADWAKTGIVDGKWDEFRIPTGEDLLVELATLIIPGAAGSIQAGRAKSKLSADIEASDKVLGDHLTKLSNPAEAAAHLSKRLGANVSADDMQAALDLTGPAALDDTLRAADSQHMATLERAAGHEERGNDGRAIIARQMALRDSRSRQDIADEAAARSLTASMEISGIREAATSRAAEAAQLNSQLEQLTQSGQEVPPDLATAAAQASFEAESLRQSADRAAALVKIAKGRENVLTTAEQAALEMSETPAIEEVDGGIVITDAGRAEIQKLAPTAASYIRQSETQRREQLTRASQANASTLAPDGITVETAGAAVESAADSSKAGAGAGIPRPLPSTTSAAPANANWTAKGTKGTPLTLPASEAKSPQEAAEKMAGMLPKGEDFDGTSIMPPKRTEKASKSAKVAPKAEKTEPVATAPVDKSGDTKGYKAAVFRHNAEAQTRSYLPKKAHARAARVTAAMEKALATQARFFSKVKFATPNGKTGGVSIDTDSRSLIVRLPDIVNQTSTLSEDELDAYLDTLVKHEATHRFILDVTSNNEAANAWNQLGTTPEGITLQQDVIKAYEAGGSKLTSDFAKGHEMLRMFFEDEVFAGRVTEAASVSPSFKEALRNFLQNLADYLRKNFAKLPDAQKAPIREILDKAKAHAKALGVEIVEAEQQAGPAIEAADARITQAGTAEATTAPAGVLTGNAGTLYTSTGEPVEYQWAVVEAADLLPSHDKDGKPTPGYEQGLQPRTGARSQGQKDPTVAEIRRRMAYHGLSDAKNAREGSPVIDGKMQVEAGNGRALGIQLGYADGKPAAAAYKAEMVADAANKGFDAEKVKAMKAPVLVRVRTTNVDAAAFAADSNQGGAARMTKRDQAVADAKNLTPDTLAQLEVDDTGNLFSAANMPFFRQFFRETVGQQELASLVNVEDGTLNQAGLERIRNAVFVAAYGDSESSMAAFERLAESVDDDPAKNLSRALMSAAPQFARLEALIRDGVRHPVSIAGEVAKAANIYATARDQRQTITDYLAQVQLIPDGATDLTRSILRFIEANKQSSLRIAAGFRGHAQAVEALGDPRQGGLFGAEPVPSAAELWEITSPQLNSARRLPDTGTGDLMEWGEQWKAVNPKFRGHNFSVPTQGMREEATTALKAYRQLSKLIAQGAKLPAEAYKRLENAERTLGQMFMFDGELGAAKRADSGTLDFLGNLFDNTDLPLWAASAAKPVVADASPTIAPQAEAAPEVTDTRIREDLPEAEPIIAQIDAITKRGEERHAAAHPDIRGVTHPSDYLEPAEKAEIHRLKMMLRPKSRDEAKADIAKRRAERKPKSVVEPATKPTAQKPTDTVDAGEELKANRRGKVISRLNWSEISNLNDTLKASSVTKDRAFPRPDYAELIAEGMTPRLAFMVKRVYDAISSKPETREAATDEQLQNYITTVQETMDKTIAWAKSPEAAASFVAVRQYWDTNKALFNVIFPGGTREIPDRFRLLDTSKLINATQFDSRDIKKADAEVDKGWPGKQEKWQKQGYTIVPKSDIGIRTGGYRFAKGSMEKIPVFALNLVNSYTDFAFKDTREEAQAILDGYKPFLLLRKGGGIESQHDTAEEAAEAARAVVSPAGREGKVTEKGLSAAEARRIGKERRAPGQNITAEELIETFGFRGVNFGNWMKGDGNKTERQLHLNHTYDSFMDLADVLGVPPRALSLNGMLGLAFGAQGNGGGAKAHFVPGMNEINLTRESGAGSVAHEWGHALDHHFGVQAGHARDTQAFITEHSRHGGTIRPEVVKAFYDIVKAMRTRPQTPEEIAAAKAAGDVRNAKYIQNWLKAIRRDFESSKADLEKFDALAARATALDLGDGKVKAGNTYLSPVVDEMRQLYKATTGRAYSLDQSKGLQGNLDAAVYSQKNKAAETTHIPQTDTNYLKSAKGLDDADSGKSYWATNVEMFARAFDSYAYDTLKEQGVRNTYLSHAGNNPKTTPQEAERTKINAAFGVLIGEMKTRETERGTELFAAARADGPISRRVDLSERVREMSVSLAEHVQTVNEARQRQADAAERQRDRLSYVDIARTIATAPPDVAAMRGSLFTDLPEGRTVRLQVGNYTVRQSADRIQVMHDDAPSVVAWSGTADQLDTIAQDIADRASAEELTLPAIQDEITEAHREATAKWPLEDEFIRSRAQLAALSNGKKPLAALPYAQAVVEAQQADQDAKKTPAQLLASLPIEQRKANVQNARDYDASEGLSFATFIAEKNAPLIQNAIDSAAHEAATSPLNDVPEPTEAQKRSGNYKLGHLKLGPLDLSIENPAGSVRRGKDASGKAWETPMFLHYGYIKGSKSADGDHIDLFVSPGTPEDFTGRVFVINQKAKDGTFDEHKAVLGPNITTAKDALAAYLANYTDGWDGAQSVGLFRDLASFTQWATGADFRRAPAKGALPTPMPVSKALLDSARAEVPRFRTAENRGELTGEKRENPELASSARIGFTEPMAANKEAAQNTEPSPGGLNEVDAKTRRTRLATQLRAELESGQSNELAQALDQIEVYPNWEMRDSNGDIEEITTNAQDRSPDGYYVEHQGERLHVLQDNGWRIEDDNGGYIGPVYQDPKTAITAAKREIFESLGASSFLSQENTEKWKSTLLIDSSLMDLPPGWTWDQGGKWIGSGGTSHYAYVTGPDDAREKLSIRDHKRFSSTFGEPTIFRVIGKDWKIESVLGAMDSIEEELWGKHRLLTQGQQKSNISHDQTGTTAGAERNPGRFQNERSEGEPSGSDSSDGRRGGKSDFRQGERSSAGLSEVASTQDALAAPRRSDSTEDGAWYEDADQPRLFQHNDSARSALDTIKGTMPSGETMDEVNRLAGVDFSGADLTPGEVAQMAENVKAGIDYTYHQRRQSEKHADWNDKASEMIDADPQAVLARLVQDARDGKAIDNPVLVKAAQLMIPALMRQAISTRNMSLYNDAQAIAYAYDITGTEQGRALAARWQPHKSAEDKHREVIAKMIFNPPVDVQAAVQAAKTPKAKQAEIDRLQKELDEAKASATAALKDIEAKMQAAGADITALRQSIAAERSAFAREKADLEARLKAVKAEKDRAEMLADWNKTRLEQVEEGLAGMGVTLSDLFVSKEAVVRLRGSTIVSRALSSFNPTERKAQALRMEGMSDRQISTQTGISRSKLPAIFSRVDAALETSFGEWVDRGFTVESLMSDDMAAELATPARANLTAEERKARVKAFMGLVQPTEQARRTGAVRKMSGNGPSFGFDISNPAHATRVARAIQSIDSTGFDAVYEYWINGLLSGPATHAANVIGNVGNVLLEYGIQRPAEAMVNTLLMRDAAGASFSEYSSMAKYLGQAFSDAFHYAKITWQTEVSLFENQWTGVGLNASGLQGNSPRAAIPDKWGGRFIRIPSRMLMFADEFAKRIVGRIEAAAQAHRFGMAQGLSGAALDSYVKAQVSTPGSNAWLQAVKQAKAMTFQQELPGWLEKFQELKEFKTTTPWGSAGKFLLRMLFPFIKTPWNITATGLRKTPLGTLRMLGKVGSGLYDHSKGKPFFDSYTRGDISKDLAEQLVGYVAFVIIAGMAEGDPDDDKKGFLITGTRGDGARTGERELLQRSRGGEMNFVVNGKPVFNYGRYEPFATVLATIVNGMRRWKETERGVTAHEALWKTAGDFIETARTKTFLQGMDSALKMLDAVGGGETVPDSLMKTVVTGIVPNIIRQPLRNTDDQVRDTRNAPLLYHAFPVGSLAEPLYDLYGRPVTKGGDSISRLLFTMPTDTQAAQSADTALNRWNAANPLEKYTPSNPSKSMFRWKDAAGKWHEMTPSQIATYRLRAGREFAAKAATIFPTPTAPTAEQIAELRRLRDASFSETKKAMFPTLRSVLVK